MQDSIDYPTLIDNAMRGVVRDLLKEVKKFGLPGAHHCFISFRTDAPGVKISDAIKARYPQEMTIVLQHQFWDLKIEQDYFSVMLSFNNVPEKLHVPFTALTAFADPSVKFGLQFHASWEEIEAAQEHLPFATVGPGENSDFEDDPAAHGELKDEKPAAAEVISLDSFRKK